MTDQIVRDAFLEFLKSNKTAVISTVSQDGKPMSATIYFAVDEYLNLYFMTKRFTRKFQNLEKNNEVALVIGTTNEPVTAQMQGVAERVEGNDEITLRMEQLGKVFKDNATIAPLFQLNKDVSEIFIYKVKPYWVRWLDHRDPNGSKDFIQIIP